MAKKKMGLSDRLNNINKNKNNKVNVVSPKPVIQEAKVPKKQGRPTYKKEGVKYERIFTDIPKELKNQLKLLLLTKFNGVYDTQSEIILAAIEEYVEKHQG